jgi:hypothetical protein
MKIHIFISDKNFLSIFYKIFNENLRLLTYIGNKIQQLSEKIICV